MQKLKNNGNREGMCPNCGAVIRRSAPADLAVCCCTNPPVEVRLYDVPSLSTLATSNHIIAHRERKRKVRLVR